MQTYFSVDYSAEWRWVWTYPSERQSGSGRKKPQIVEKISFHLLSV